MLIDLSAPGAFGDFAFLVTNTSTQRKEFFDAYHTGEASIFLDVLHAMTFDRPVAEVLDDVARIRSDVLDRTGGMTPTTLSEHNFDRLLTRITDALHSHPLTREYRAHAHGKGILVCTPTAVGLRFTTRNGPAPRPRDPHVDVPAEQLWQFAAGMTWRSYNDTGSRAPMLTRLSTVAYESALATFENAVRGSTRSTTGHHP